MTRVPSCKLHEGEILHASLCQRRLSLFELCRSWLGLPETSNVRGHTASEPLAISKQPPNEFQETSTVEGSHSLGVSLAKSTRKLIQNQCREQPRGSPIRVKIGPGTFSGRPMALKSVPETPQECLGSVSGHPRRAPGAPRELPRAHQDAQTRARERLRASQGDQNRRQVASRSAKIKFSSRNSFTNPFRIGFSMISSRFLR